MNFNEILGNQEVKAYLDSSINNNTITHSYMFSGISGIGKCLIAREFARKILCNEKGAGDCTCKSCVLIKENSSPDFNIIDENGKTIKIDIIRNLIEKVIEKPIISKRKVYIINDFENMTKEAQNCLLKTLEEPPEYATIILVTSDENKILTTIKSRCTIVKFVQLSNEEIKTYASKYLNENINEEMIEYCGGSIGKTIEVLEHNDIYQNISKAFENIQNKSIKSFWDDCKSMYDKENIYNLLDFLIVLFYSKSKDEIKYLYCVDFINEAIKRLRVNTNFEMSIDNMLLKIWEAFNEKSNRC